MLFQLIEYGLVVPAAPRFTPSSMNWMLVTPTLSEAVAETVTFAPETVALLAGAVMDTVGDTESPPFVAGLTKFLRETEVSKFI